MGRDAADDLTAEVFLAAFDRRARYDLARPDARPWLYGIAANLVRRHRRVEVRRLRAQAREAARPRDGGDDADERLDGRAAGPALARALASLPARQREPLLLLACEGGCSMDDLRLIAAFAPEHGPDAAARRRARARLEERLAGARSHPRARRRLVVASTASAVAAAAVAAAVLSVGGPAGGPAVERAHAAVDAAATATASAARSSGTAVVRITHDGEPWAGSTIRWHGDDLDVSRDVPARLRPTGSMLRVVGGTLYGLDPGDGGWVELGSPQSIDPGSGTTPGEYLAAAREDVSGATLRRISAGIRGLTTRPGDAGSTVYSGTVAAGLIARETGSKEGRAIRVLPFGYVAHGAAADPSALLDVDVTVGGDGLVRRIAVGWGTADSPWTYAVDYGDLGATTPIAAPEGAAPLRAAGRR